MKLEDKILEEFEKRFSSSDFCGCFEGDLGDRWEEGLVKVKEFFTEALKRKEEEQQEDIKSVLNMLAGVTEREKIANFIKRYLLKQEETDNDK